MSESRLYWESQSDKLGKIMLLLFSVQAFVILFFSLYFYIPDVTNTFLFLIAVLLFNFENICFGQNWAKVRNIPGWDELGLKKYDPNSIPTSSYSYLK